MSSKNTSRIASLLTLAVMILGSGVSMAQNAKPSQKDAGIDQLECRTLLKLGGDERSYTLLYYHGFVSGKLNQMKLEVQTMAEVTDKVVEHCIDHPGDMLLPVFEKYRKAK